jgi:hypothetical protein
MCSTAREWGAPLFTRTFRTSKICSNRARDGYGTGSGAPGSADVPLAFSLEFFRHIHSHRRIYDLTVGRPSEVTIHRFFGQMLCNLVSEDLLGKIGSRRTSKQMETTVQFLVGALWSLAVWWLSTRSTIRAEDLDAQFHRLADPSVERFLAA